MPPPEGGACIGAGTELVDAERVAGGAARGAGRAMERDGAARRERYTEKETTGNHRVSNEVCRENATDGECRFVIMMCIQSSSTMSIEVVNTFDGRFNQSQKVGNLRFVSFLVESIESLRHSTITICAFCLPHHLLSAVDFLHLTIHDPLRFVCTYSHG
jgi:hypothetical protein